MEDALGGVAKARLVPSPVLADTVAKLICQSPATNFSEHD